MLSAASQDQSENFAVVATFTAEEDLTLRQVHFICDSLIGAAKNMALSTDPSFTRPPTGTTSNEFQLRPPVQNTIAQAYSFENLAFPIRKGQKLYWGIDGTAQVDQFITLVFT